MLMLEPALEIGQEASGIRVQKARDSVIRLCGRLIGMESRLVCQRVLPFLCVLQHRPRTTLEIRWCHLRPPVIKTRLRTRRRPTQAEANYSMSPGVFADQVGVLLFGFLK